jgi:hypothetical protein
LVYPAERIVGREGLGWQGVEGLLKGLAAFRSEPQPRARVVETEDSREDLRRESGGDSPGIRFAELGSELLALGERDRRTVLRMQQHAILGKEAREKQAMPLLIPALSYEDVPVATKLAPLCPETVAQRCLMIVEVFRAALSKHPEPFDCGPRRALRGTPRGHYCSLELLSKRRRQRAHVQPQMITVLRASR